MSVKQISVFVESKPGHLSRVLDAFESAGVNVRGFSASDTQDFGIVRFVVDDPQRALSVLKELGMACREGEVLCVRLEDKPGELARVMEVLAARGINVVYCYSLISTYIAISVDDQERAEKLLADEPIDLVNQKDLAEALGAVAAEEA